MFCHVHSVKDLAPVLDRCRADARLIDSQSHAFSAQQNVGCRQVFDAVNMAEQLIRSKLAAGRDVVDDLQEAIVAIMDRQRGTPSRALHQAEQDALRDFSADYAGLLSGVTQQQYMMAQRGVDDRIRRILSGERIPASMRIVEAVGAESQM